MLLICDRIGLQLAHLQQQERIERSSKAKEHSHVSALKQGTFGYERRALPSMKPMRPQIEMYRTSITEVER
jgi:hypothetical protein